MKMCSEEKVGIELTSKKVLRKRQLIEENILSSASPLIEDGSYSQYTVRDLCSKIGITTGMFYRHFKTKNDLLSFYSINKLKELYKAEEERGVDADFREKLLRLSLIGMESNLKLGPECIVIFMNNENPLCDCSVGRNIIVEEVCKAFKNKLSSEKYSEEEAIKVATYLIVVQKGLCYEWYSNRDNPSFDIMDVSEKMIRQAIKSLDLPEA